MSKLLINTGISGVVAAALLAATPIPASASAVTDLVGNPDLIQVADGCGPNGWRGPGGACHFYRGGWGYGPYRARGPWAPGPYWNGGCRPGMWRGPHGHCRW